MNIQRCRGRVKGEAGDHAPTFLETTFIVCRIYTLNPTADVTFGWPSTFKVNVWHLRCQCLLVLLISISVQSKQTFNKLKSMLANKHLSYQIRELVLQCHVYSVLTLGYEAWVMGKSIEKKVRQLKFSFSKNAKSSMDRQTY